MNENLINYDALVWEWGGWEKSLFGGGVGRSLLERGLGDYRMDPQRESVLVLFLSLQVLTQGVT
jgi:hypothetical protein